MQHNQAIFEWLHTFSFESNIGRVMENAIKGVCSASSCNGKLYIDDSKLQIKRKMKTEHNKIQTMHNQKCFLSKRYQMAALHCFIKTI